MLERLRNQIGTAGLLVAIVALVAALGGGAYAASGGDSGGKATASAKQGKQGKPGKTGKTGPAGPAGPAGATGPAGPAGAKGDAGAAGSNGTNGAPGAPGAAGTSVTSEQFVGTKDGQCEGHGGSKFVAGASNTYACNGKPGEPWTAGGFLPEGETETGVWTGFASGEESSQFFPVSFTIPLKTAPTPVVVGTTAPEKAAGALAGCPGQEANGEPTADPGKLCVYINQKAGTLQITMLDPSKEISFPSSFDKATPSGSAGVLSCEAGSCSAFGTWAVTAAEE